MLKPQQGHINENVYSPGYIIILHGCVTSNQTSIPIIKLVFHLTYTMMHGSTKVKFDWSLVLVKQVWVMHVKLQQKLFARAVLMSWC